MSKILKTTLTLGIMMCTTTHIMTAGQHPDKTDTLQQRDKVDSLQRSSRIDSLDNAFLDSLDLKKKVTINDYSMIGIQYGVGMSRPMWNPSMKQSMLFVPYNFGILYTRYGKMFGYMPYFGFQIGVFYGQEGYKFKADDNGYIPDLEGATSAVMEVIEIPFMAHCHFDFWKMKVMINLGLFGGYRLSIARNGADPSIADSFLPTDNRFDYGLKGGAGFAFVFDPVEIHFNASYKHSLSSLYKPDYYSEYYYRFAYPTNFVFSIGLHFQLTKRIGKTKHDIKKEAKAQLGLTKTLESIGQR